jgi:phosphoribosylamine--glycine ligase
VRVLLLGSGGREHAIAAALAVDPAVTALICAPGNPGMAPLGELVAVDPLDPAAVATLAAERSVDLVVVGPEAPLVAGVSDAVRAKGIPCFGPSKAAATLEGSKAFAKDVMRAAGVPTSRSFVCTTPAELAAALDELGAPYVVKDDGLAAGKGVVVTDDREAALAHGAACERVVVEEYLAGPEVSLFVVTDGVAAVPLQPWAPPDLVEEVMASVVQPTLAEMRHRGTPFAGVLYVGLALTAGGPKVIEFNCRFGDPETQVVLARLETPLAGVLHAAAVGRLAEDPPLAWRSGSAVCVVMASAGYPESSRKGDVITGADGVPGVIHAGTARRDDGALVTNGGRVLACTAFGADLSEARDAAYRLVHGVQFAGAQFRNDIALAAAEGKVETLRDEA